MPHRQSVKDSDPHFTIDSASRQILNKSSKQISLIQGDHNSERFTFDLPREIEKHDMSLCNKVQIHYINIGANGEQFADVYEPSDFGVSATDDKIVTCSWLISGNATKYAGTLNFIVRYLCIVNGEIVYSWGTAIYKGIPVSDTINNGVTVIENYSDILIAWMNETEKSVDIKVTAAVENAVAEKVSGAVNEAVDSIVGDAVDKAIENSLDLSNIANAIKANVSGTSITIDDLSPLTSKLKVKVVGKQPPEAPAALMMMRSAAPAATGDELVNLIPFTRDDGYLGYKDAVVGKSVTNNGITYKVNNDGSITMIGVSSNKSTFILYESEENLASFATGRYYTLYKGGTDKYDVFVKYFNSETSTFSTFLLGDGSSAFLPASASGIQILLTVTKGKTISDSVTFYPMIVEGRNVAITKYETPQGANADGGNHTHIDADKDHFCDICGERLSACVDNNNDHLCEYCGERMTECVDDDNDHFCDKCGKRLSECVDDDMDHDCDICGATMGRHWDDTKDHKCDYCGEVVTDHVDEDMNHVCDVCGHVMGEHKDNGKGYCDYCGESMHDCVDTDGDGLCDICGVDIHICADDDNDHLCDKCDKRLSECVDNDRDHVCDICGKEMGDHVDGDEDHKCDYCGGSGFGVHADEDGDGFCDYCGEPIIAVTLKIASAADPDTIIKTIKTTYGAIVELTPIFPSMIITTDKDDALLSAEYNKDTNKVVGNIETALDAIIAIQEGLIGGASE